MSTQPITALAERKPMQELEMVEPRQATALTLDSKSMDSMIKLAELMATGKATMPPEYRGNPADCLAVVMQAVQWRMNPFAVAQKTYFVSGKIGYEAQLINAVIISLAPTLDRPHYEFYGPWEKVIGKFDIRKGDKGEYRVPGWHLADEEGIGIRVWATIKGEAEPRVLDLLLAQARTRNSTLWADDPRQQLAYLGIKRWARLYTPDVILGVYSPDELEEIPQNRERDITPRNATPQQIGQAAARVETTDEAQGVERAKLIAELESTAQADGPSGLGVHWKEVLTKEQRKLVGAEEMTRIKGVAEAAVEAAKSTGTPDPAFVAGMEGKTGD